MKSAGFVSGLGVFFRVFHFSTVTPVTVNFLIHTQKVFVYVIPKYLFGCLLSGSDRPFFRSFCFLFVSLPGLSLRPHVGLGHLPGMLQLVDSGRFFRRYRESRNHYHFLHRLIRLPRFRSRISFADFVQPSAFRLTHVSGFLSIGCIYHRLL